MEPLLKAIQDLAEEYSFDGTLPSSCALLAKYVATGDEKLLPRLLKMDEGEINVIGQVGKAIARPDKFGDTDRRLLRFFAHRSIALNGGNEDVSHGDLSDHPLPRCLEPHLLDEQPNENLFGIILAELRLVGVEEARWRRLTARFVQALAKGKRLTSAGRYLLGLPAAQLAELMPRIKCNKNRDDFVAAFISEAPEILARVMDELVQQDKVRDFPFGGWLAALEANPTHFESRAVAAFRLFDDKYREKSVLAMSLETHFPGKYRAEALKAVGDGLGWATDEVKAARWLIERQGPVAISAIASYVAGFQPDNNVIQDKKIAVLKAAVNLLASAARPALVAAIQRGMPELSLGALELWNELGDSTEDLHLEKKLVEELAGEESKALAGFIPVAASWKVSRLAPRFWQLLEHKSKPVREAAAQALSKMGDEAVPKAVVLLQAKKTESRRVASLLLIAVGTPQSWQALQSHLERETADDVRDLIRKTQSKQSKFSDTAPDRQSGLASHQPAAESTEANLEITTGEDFLGVTLPNGGLSYRIPYPIIHRKRVSPLAMLSLAMDIFGADNTEAAEKCLLESLNSDNPPIAIAAIAIAMAVNAEGIAPYVWPLLNSKSKWVRETAAEGLAKLGDEAIPKAGELLAVRKADTRKAAAVLLASIASDRARQVLRDHLKQESSADIGDLIQKSLAKEAKNTKTSVGPKSPMNMQTPRTPLVDQKQVEAAIASAAPKIKSLPADWINESALPAIYFSDGSVLNKDAVRYLLYRQSREKEMAADTEAALLYAVIDRKRSGDFALAVLNSYLGSQLDAKDRWALAVAGLLGDDRIVPLLTKRIAEWSEAARGKLAEYAVQALALLASDAALLAVDAMAIRYRTKFKNIGKAAGQAFAAAADARGLSPAELGDRVLPWLGFEPGKARVLEFGDHRIEVSIGLDCKLAWRDLVKGKAVKSLPASAPDEIKAEMKELSAGLKEAAKAQLLRMENLMVQQHRWPVARWGELFLAHPLVFPFAARLVWGAFGTEGRIVGTFRALEDRSLTSAGDESFPKPIQGTVGIVHPLELTPEQRQAWLKHLADYNVVPPFAQLERPVVSLKPGQENVRVSKELEGTELNAMTFKGRAERLGWSRGSVVDAGGVNYYYKQFPAAGVDVFIALEGMYVGIDMYSDITLGQVMFVKHRSVQVGSYTYDEPSGEKDGRLVPFGEVPPIAFSEAMGDLVKISGKAGPPAED